MSYLKLYLLFLITFSFGAKAQNNSAIVNDVLISISNNIIWISDNIHSDVRGVSMINGKEVVFLPHRNYVAKIYETDKHLITVNDFVRFWDKEDYSLQDSIALDNFYLNAQIPKENTLTNITLSSLQLVDLKTKNIKKISLPNHELTNAKVKINSSGRIFFIKPNSVLELINEKVTEIYKSKEFIKGSIINDQGIHLLLSPELFRTDIKTSIKIISFEGKELSHIYIDDIPHLKIGLGELNSYNPSNTPYFNMFGSSYLLQTTSGLVALSNSWKQYLISGFYDLPYANVNYKNFNGQFVRTDGGKVTVFDLWGSILYQENIESLYSSFNITNQDKMSLLNTLYLIGVDGERTNKQEFTWNNYILPVNVSNKDNFLTFHKNGEVNVWNYSNFNKEYKWEISGNKRPLFATFQIDKTHILTLFPDSKKIVVYDLNGKIINQQNYDIEDFITAISSTNEGIYIGTSSGDVHQLDDKLKIISSHKDVFGEAVSSITFLEKSKELILGSRGRLIRCPLSIGKISPEQVTKVHNGYITDLSTQHFSGHDFLLTNSFFDNSCFLWDLKTKSLVKSYKQEKNIQYAQLIDSLNVPMNVDSIGFTFDSNLDLVKKLKSDKPEVYLQASVTSPIRKISFSKDQNLILVLSQNIVYILDVKTRKVITQIEVTDDNINDAILDDNSREVIITQGDNLKSYDIASGKIIREIKFDHVGNFSVHRLRKVPATPFILGINTHGWTNPFVIHENSGKVITRYGIPLDGNRIYDIQFSKSGQFMAVYTNKEVVVYKDYLTNKPIKVFKYDRKSEVSYTTMNIVHIDEDQNLLMFVAKVEGRTCTLIYDYIEQKLIKNIKYNYLADIVGNSIVYGHMDGIKQVSLEDDSKSFFNAKKDFMSDLSAIAYNEKYDLVIGGDIWGNIKLFDNKSKNELAAIDRFQNDIYNFKKYKNHFIYNHKEGLFIIDNKKFENKLIENASNYPFYADLSEDETHIIYLESSSSKDKPFVYVENLKTGISTKLFQLPVTSNNLSVFTLSENHIIYSYKIDNTTYFASYDIDNNSNEILIETEKNLVLDNQSTTKNLYYVEILNDDNKKILTTKTYDYQLIDKKKNLLHTVEYHLDDHKDINTRNLQKYLKNFQLISSSGYQVYQTEDGINIFDYRSKKHLLKEFDQVKNKLFKYHVASNTLYIISEENEVISYNLTTKTLNTLFTINSNIEQIDLHENELIILSSDEKLKSILLMINLLNIKFNLLVKTGLV
ncbi:hypothetical protein MY04_4725 [Flammeovirga sp. MY04]|uniref:hypothetical protein n=1 Tax=Flammeovirga sp. MY04 TaxID=1191459 RepID=UPI0008061D53|nr:hypothetical protein [Flammeovirga sp. MY04]ANQ52060.1 hypothetical protein MY04_4725 [Flammeovirga sp. MY04]